VRQKEEAVTMVLFLLVLVVGVCHHANALPIVAMIGEIL
jgi:hypothetical protein